MLVCLASRRDDTSSRRMEQWTDGRPDGMARSSGRLTGNLNSFDLHTLNSRITVYNIFTLINDFVQTQNEAKILTNSPFGHSGTKIT